MVNSVEKSARILVYLARNGSSSAARVSTALDLPRSTAYKILVTLESQGFVERDQSQGFHLGYRLIELGHRAQEEVDLFSAAHPYLAALNETTDETVHLTVLDGDQVLYVDCVESTRRLRTHSVIGLRGPLHSTAVGKAILAFSDASLFERVVANGLPAATPATLTSPKALEHELEATRDRGYAIDDLENDPDIRCVAAPIRSTDGAVVASVSISGPSGRVTRERIADLAPLVIEAARGISERAGSIISA
jgi:DNA-binding IclR family transcriptional regulator